jgi:hypothetical protein
MKTLRALVAAGLVVATFGVAIAKLPPPAPPTEEQKKAAEEKKAKDAAAAEAAKAAQARAEDRVAARYYAEMKAKGKQVSAPQMQPGAPVPVISAPAPTKTSAAQQPAMATKPADPAKK